MPDLTPNHDFAELSQLIEERRALTVRLVNQALIDLYWEVGKTLSRKIEDSNWGKSTITALANFLKTQQPGLRGFSASNLWRMRQFYETYRGHEVLAPLVRELSWSSNLIILGRAKTEEEQEFYLRMTIQENWSRRALERNVRKEHENPSIGILLCASKDDEVVEYALSRSLSPALVAEYQTKLPDKALLQAKLHEFLSLEADQDNP
jgi:predicted nuclease of restriction endonuclease-like (RecB) superfamily